MTLLAHQISFCLIKTEVLSIEAKWTIQDQETVLSMMGKT